LSVLLAVKSCGGVGCSSPMPLPVLKDIRSRRLFADLRQHLLDESLKMFP
jgi:hypothetical protein